jgi:shikimate dehydrogenase
VEHSLSPAIHNYWLRMLGLHGEYVKAPVAPEDFAEFVRQMPEQGFAGGNVTVPHKIAAMALCDRLEPAAQAIGAVNTLWFEDGRLCGDNTDAAGFLANLDAAAPGWDREREAPAIIIGAGGAARAVTFALTQRGFRRLRLVNRTLSTAEQVAQLGPSATEVLPLTSLDAALGDARVIVNASSLGMAGGPPLDVDFSAADPQAVACDIVYAPLETGFLRAARSRNLRAVDGLGMLLHQAAPGFARWFGAIPEVTPDLRRHVLAARGVAEAARAS